MTDVLKEGPEVLRECRMKIDIKLQSPSDFSPNANWGNISMTLILTTLPKKARKKMLFLMLGILWNSV